MIIQLMGPQACGKGTQGRMLSSKLGLPLIGMGDLLRNMPKSHPDYEVAQKQMAEGLLVDHRIPGGLLRARVAQPDCSKGYILDGWSRDLDQLAVFDPNPNYLVYINIPREESFNRIAGRRVCTADGKTYNLYTMTPDEIAGCKGEFVLRADDNEEAIKVRLDIFYNRTMKVIEKYKKEAKLIEVDGMGTPDEVFSRIIDGLEKAENRKIG